MKNQARAQGSTDLVLQRINTLGINKNTHTCKEIARGSLTAKDVWKTLKDQLEGQESHTKIYLLTLLYTTKQEEGSLDVYGYVKSIEAI
jgi:hypothetical protein